MANLISVDSGSVRPSQDFLKPDTLSHIVNCYKNGELDRLPPPPIVRKDSDGSLIAIDGHNILAVNFLLSKQTEVYVVDDGNDSIPGESEAVSKRNADLKEKFNSALQIAQDLKLQDINTISDLVKHTGVGDLVENSNL